MYVVLFFDIKQKQDITPDWKKIIFYFEVRLSCGCQFEEADPPSRIGVSVDHDVPGILVVAEPLPRVVSSLAAVEVLVELVPTGTDHHQVAAPGIAGPARPLAGAIGGVWVLVTGAAQEEVVTSIVQSNPVHFVMYPLSIEAPGLAVCFPPLLRLGLTVDLQSKVVPVDDAVPNGGVAAQQVVPVIVHQHVKDLAVTSRLAVSLAPLHLQSG